VIDVALPDLSRPLFVALRKRAEHVLEQLGRTSFKCLSPTIAPGALISASILTVRLAMLFARPRPVRGCRRRGLADKFAQVDRHWLPARDGHDRPILDLALESVYAGSVVATISAARADSELASESMASSTIFSAAVGNPIRDSASLSGSSTSN
jgi:hypothetical protein